MSGHSHYSTIKRQKESNDAAKGRVFSKHAKAIALAIKNGGGADPDKNSKLRFTIDQAKANNMPKANIDRILSRADEVGDLQEITYEGFGAEGIGIIIETATDNKNRTSQEIKNILERGGGSMAGPGSVLYNFEKKGLLIVEKNADVESQMLAMIDLGVEDIEETDNELESYVNPTITAVIKQKLDEAGYRVKQMQLILKPKNLVTISDSAKAQKVINLLNNLEEQDDTQNVYANIDIPQDILNTLK